jgi:hypothetical protein
MPELDAYVLEEASPHIFEIASQCNRNSNFIKGDIKSIVPTSNMQCKVA